MENESKIISDLYKVAVVMNYCRSSQIIYNNIKLTNTHIRYVIPKAKKLVRTFDGNI